jgi:hypothetical protein
VGAPLLGTPSIQSVHDYYPFALEDGGRLSPTAVELFDRLAIMVVVHRIVGMDSAVSCPMRSDNSIRMKEVLLNMFLSARCWGLYVRREVILCNAFVCLFMGSYLRDALREGCAGAFAYLPVL